MKHVLQLFHLLQQCRSKSATDLAKDLFTKIKPWYQSGAIFLSPSIRLRYDRLTESHIQGVRAVKSAPLTVIMFNTLALWDEPIPKRRSDSSKDLDQVLPAVITSWSKKKNQQLPRYAINLLTLSWRHKKNSVSGWDATGFPPKKTLTDRSTTKSTKGSKKRKNSEDNGPATKKRKSLR